MMMARALRWGVIAVGAMLVLAPARAGDDVQRMDLKKSSSVGLGGVGAFSHEARATAGDDDVEDVLYRYSRGYARGYYGGGYYFPRTYAFRSGYYAGFYGYGYSPRYYWGGYYAPRYYYGPRYYSSYYYAYPTATYYYAAPVATYYDPVVVTAAPTLMPPPMRSADEPPLARPRAAQPAQSGAVYPYNEPPPKTAPRPLYRYDGGPNAVPMPPAEPSATPAPKAGAVEGRIVMLGLSSKKPAYPAYGDNRRSDGTDDLRTVKKVNE